jgi:serine/threonine-protein kinase
MVLMYVPAGEFRMGSRADERVADLDEMPQHTVYLDAFWIDRTEVTNAMFARFVAKTGYLTQAERTEAAYITFAFDPPTGGWADDRTMDWRSPHGVAETIDGLDNYPVVVMSWNDAQAYCTWAGRAMPTEAQWEKAARGTDRRLYPWGDEPPTGARANLCDRSCSLNLRERDVDDGYVYAAPVGSFPAGASPYGALDMAGNVWEWVADWYTQTYDESSPPQNPAGPESGAGDYRVLRGGAWEVPAPLIRTAMRFNHQPFHAYDNFGFRCARSE